MRKLKGIIINGEWLGENVVVNGMFRTLSSMAPFVMFEFVKLINQIDKLEEAVAIKKFDFLDNNSIEIEFTNSQIDGIADLYFKLHNGMPELLNKSLRVADFTTPQIKEEVEVYEAVNIEEDVKEHISKENTQENAQEEASLDNNEEVVNDATDISEKIEEIQTQEEHISENEEATEDVISDLYEENSPMHDTEKTENENKKADELLETKNAISMLVNDLAKNAQNLPPVQIQLVQTSAQQPKQAEIAESEENNNLSQVQDTVEEKNQPIVAQEITNDILEEQENEINNEATLLENENFETFEQESDKFKNESIENSDTSEFDNFEENDFSEEPVAEKSECSSVDEQTNNQIETDEYNLDENIEANIDENFVEKNQVEKVSDDTDEEEIQECLAGFYEAPKTEDFEEICTQNTDNVVMQAMLSEMVMLKEELNRLKEEPQKPDLATFWGDNDKKSNYIDDSEADFRIMGSEKRVNASILDEEMFVAGDKLYKWGDMLYLDE